MAGITSTLNIAQGALAAQQYGLNVTGNNIANVNNPSYSLQEATQTNNTPALYSGFLFGTGVNVDQIRQSVDQMLENRLTDEKSTQAAFEEAEGYMAIIESIFDASSETSINTMLTEFWNSWHDLADNPTGSSERNVVYETGQNFAARIQTAEQDLATIGNDINMEITSAVAQINTLTEKIADLNQQISVLELNRTANDLRDQRNQLVSELGALIEVDTFEQSNGGMIVNVAGGLTLVNGMDSKALSISEHQIIWNNSSGYQMDITDDIDGGKLSGWLDIRDEIIPKYSSDLDALAHEMIWAVNYQHSQGAGTDYFTGSVTGAYQADESGLLSSYDFGDKIDYANDFKMWIKDMTTATAAYRTVELDMGISEAVVSDWQGTAPDGLQGSYRLTVVDDGTLGDRRVTETDGDGLGRVFESTVDAATALNNAIADQTLTVSGGVNGTQKIMIQDIGGDALRSAAAIAGELNKIAGVTAHASENRAGFDITGNNADDGDEVMFSLYVDGMIHQERFVVDSALGNLDEQFEEALLSATEAINSMNSDQDLSTSGLSITSLSGRTLGIQDFEVQDNSGVRLDAFNNFNPGDEVTFTVDSGGTPGTSTQVTVDLTGVDTTDQAAVAQAFYTALEAGLDGQPFSVKNDLSTNSVILRTTDGSDLTLKDADNDTGANATMAITALDGTTQSPGGNNILLFDGLGDIETYGADPWTTDTIDFTGNGITAIIAENSAVAGNKAAVITGTITVLMDPGMSIQTTVSGTGSGGLFKEADAKIGSSIITLGGDGGFSGFSDIVTFDVDGIPVSYDVATAGHTTELEYAQGLEAALTTALVTPFANPDYSVVRTGKSVSIIKNKDLTDPITITDFSETGTADATLRTSTGTGSGANDPVNDLLDAGSSYRNASTATLYSDTGVIKWEKYDAEGFSTGEHGLVEVEDVGRVVIQETLNNVVTDTLSFNISAGSLVAGNTLTVNMDASGNPDPLDFTIKGTANRKNATYQFSVKSGGKVGTVPADGEEPLVIQWTNGDASGSFEVPSTDPPLTPLTPAEVKVDGMTLKFYDGTLFDDDVFTITTDSFGNSVATNADGKSTGDLASSWHWTQDSFVDQFNTQAGGLKASVTTDNRLKFEAAEDYRAMVNLEYSGANGFSQDNATIVVKDWTHLKFSADDITFDRDDFGQWRLLNDPTGGKAVLIPEGGDDDGFGVDFSGDGLADIEIQFNKRVTGDGSVKFDLDERDADDMGFAFSSDASSPDAGLVAAAGINTFFTGNDAQTMEMDQRLSDTRFIAAGQINSDTGEIDALDNANAHLLDNIQFQALDMEVWNFDRGSDGFSSLTTTTLDGYYSTMISSMGVQSRSIKSAVSFANLTVNSISELRDSISAVSLDEEMIKLMKYQHAFSAASKLVSVSDEMLNTLIGMR